MASIIADVLDAEGNPSNHPYLLTAQVSDLRNAEALIERIVSVAPHHGFNREQGYWWMQENSGVVTRYSIAP